MMMKIGRRKMKMSNYNYAEKVLKTMVKERLQEIKLNATEEQLEQLTDFVNGLVMLTKAIQKDLIIGKIQEMKQEN